MLKTIDILGNAEGLKEKEFICTSPIVDLDLDGAETHLEQLQAVKPYWALIGKDTAKIEGLTGFEEWKIKGGVKE